jgi:thiamine kinase-like enzyme
MILSYSNIVHFLNLSNSESFTELDKFKKQFIDVGFRIIQTESISNDYKNNSFRVVSLRDNQFGFFLKQPKIFSQLNQVQYDREHTFYSLLSNNCSLKIPQLLNYNQKFTISTFKYIINSSTFDLLSANEEALQNLGASLSKVHTELRKFNSDDKIKGLKNLYPSGVFHLTEAKYAYYSDYIISQLNLNTIYNFVLLNPDYRKIINRAENLWNKQNVSKTLINGDFKPNNVLIDNENNYWIADWENVLFGDPEWDCATFYFNIFIQEDFMDRVKNLASIKLAMMSFLKGYHNNSLDFERLHLYFLMISIEYLAIQPKDLLNSRILFIEDILHLNIDKDEYPFKWS